MPKEFPEVSMAPLFGPCADAAPRNQPPFPEERFQAVNPVPPFDPLLHPDP
jgi:hypothetical protein